MAERPFIPAPHCASVEFIYAYSSVVAENRVNVQAATDFDLTMCQDLWTLARQWWIDYMKPYVSNTCSLNRIRVKALHANVAPMYDQVVIPSHPGQDTNTSLGNNVSFVIKLTTGNAGRSARGRWYVCGITTLRSTNGVSVSSASAGNWVNALAALQSGLQGVGQDLIVLSYRNEKAWRTEAVAYPVTGIVYTDLNLDSQRRRLLGRGR